MQKISLSDMRPGKHYSVAGFQNALPSYADKLFKMGFIEGTPVRLAPVLLTDPIVVELRGSRVALRKDEARQLIVREI